MNAGIGADPGALKKTLLTEGKRKLEISFQSYRINKGIPIDQLKELATIGVIEVNIP